MSNLTIIIILGIAIVFFIGLVLYILYNTNHDIQQLENQIKTQDHLLEDQNRIIENNRILFLECNKLYSESKGLLKTAIMVGETTLEILKKLE